MKEEKGPLPEHIIVKLLKTKDKNFKAPWCERKRNFRITRQTPAF